MGFLWFLYLEHIFLILSHFFKSTVLTKAGVGLSRLGLGVLVERTAWLLVGAGH